MRKSYYQFIFILLLVSCTGLDNNKENDDQAVIHKDTLQVIPEPGELKIISFNVRYSGAAETDPYNNWDFRKSDCLQMIKEQRPSVIGFQEAVYATQWMYFKDNLSEDYDGYGVGRQDGAENGECMGILFRTSDIEMLDHGTFWLSDSPDSPSIALNWGASHYRSATWGIFKIKRTGQKFCYINTHLDLVASAREESMKLIINRFAQYNTDNLPQFLSADFNTTNSDSIFDELKKNMSVPRDNAPKGHTDYNGTYNAWGQRTAIIDDIFYSSYLSVVEYHTITESFGTSHYLSDHYPIYAIFRFN